MAEIIELHPGVPTRERVADLEDEWFRALDAELVLSNKMHDLQAQFVQGDLTIQSGPNRGKSLPKKFRWMRMQRLIGLAREYERLVQAQWAAEERSARARDRWIRRARSAPCEDGSR